MHKRVVHWVPAPALATQTVKSEKVMSPQLVMKDSYVTLEAFSYLYTAGESIRSSQM